MCEKQASNDSTVGEYYRDETEVRLGYEGDTKRNDYQNDTTGGDESCGGGRLFDWRGRS